MEGSALAEVGIRGTLHSDFDAVREVARQGWAHAYRGVIPEGTQAEFLDRAYSNASLRRRAERGLFLVAVVNGEVVGFADFFSADDPEVVELAAIYVLPELHGRGIGTRLLEEGFARFPHARRCVLEVVRENRDARRFYEACGFRVAGESVWRFPGGEAVESKMVRALG